MISKVIKTQHDFGGSLFKLKQTAPDLWGSLKSSVKRVVNEMPLWKLQTVGSERLDFLYDNLDATTKTITLKPGVAYCFRAFYGLMRDLIQGAWVRFVQKLNANDLGNVTDLGTFLFDQERSSLEPYRQILLDVQERQCFYCHNDLRTSMEVDHFIPWSRYPTDLGHNFVLAHPRCNNSKSDYLAAEQHLQSWSERNRIRSSELGRTTQRCWLAFRFIGVTSDHRMGIRAGGEGQWSGLADQCSVSALGADVAGVAGGVIGR